MSSPNPPLGNPKDIKDPNVLKLPRQKRLKVTRACYTCRVKKIKCDGLYPCMQCRVRQRPCSFSKDGAFDSDTVESDYSPADARSDPSPSMDTLEAANNTDNDFTLEQRTRKNAAVEKPMTAQNREKHQKTIQLLDTLSTTWLAERREDRCKMDEDALYAPDIWDPEIKHNQTQFRGSKELVVQQHLINLYFRHRYAVFPIIPKRTLYDNIERRGPLFAPLLIYSMYAHAAQYAEDHADKADMYFERATAMLPEYLHTPSISTVVALCLLSLYESNSPAGQATSSRSRSRLYSGIAFRMCLDLGLHKRYAAHDRVLPREMELRKRVFWSCYCLDKMENACKGRPWMIREKDMDVDMPLLQPGDDVEEHEVLESFVAMIKLMKLCEKAFRVDSVWSPKAIVATYEQEQNAIHCDNELLLWLRSLPVHLQWTPFPSNTSAVPTQPPPSAMAAQLHLFYNFIELAVLRPYSTSNSKTIHQRCSTIATNLTQLGCAVAEQTDYILCYSFTADAIMSAVCVHVLNCADNESSFARHASLMFQRSLRTLRSLFQQRAIPGVERFAIGLSNLLAIATDDKNGQGRESLTEPSQAQDTTAQTKPPQISDSDYYANGLITPPSSGANMSNANRLHKPLDDHMVVPSDRYVERIDQDTANDLLFETNLLPWRPQDNEQPQEQQQSSSYPMNLLSVDDTWPKSDEVTVDDLLYKGSALFDASRLRESYGQDQTKDGSEDTANDLFLDDNKLTNDASDIAALVAQMRDERHQPTTGTQSHESDAARAAAAAVAAAWGNSMGTPTSTAEESLLYSLWSGSQQTTSPGNNPQNSQSSQHHQQMTSTPLNNVFPFQSSYMNIGLGVYASARQHHTDVIRQHFPGLDNLNGPARRPAILTHHGQVIVANNSSTTQDSSQR